ncbi:MAG TPA: hypothetical protein VG838_14215 [Opitutaceae bacterium]|nr:hypothetical protein [Opitutaceae bacterium]
MEKTWKVVLAFVVIFMAGTVTGSVIALRVARSFMPPQRPPGAVVEQFGAMQLQRLARQLELTDDQKEKIRPIAQKTGDDLRKLSRDSQKETHDVIARMDDQVSALLTPEQQKKFAEFQKRRYQEFLNRGYRGPGPMGGRPQGQHPRQMQGPGSDPGVPMPAPAPAQSPAPSPADAPK